MSELSGAWSDVIQREASEWVIRLHEEELLNDAERMDFLVWLRQSPAHIQEFLNAELAWTALGNHAKALEGQVAELLQLAREDAYSNVVPLHPSVQPLPSQSTPPHWTRRRLWYAAACCVLFVAGLSSYLLLRAPVAHYATAVGEQRNIRLSDGSIMEMNTASSAKVRMTQSARIVTLEQGEAFFVVAKDAHRPFRVLSDAAIVEAVGTQFDVYRRADHTIVGVTEGKVTVTQRDVGVDSASAGQPIELTAGHTLRIAADTITPAVEAKAEQLVAWRQRRLVFDNAKLSEVVAEFNRYNLQQLVVDDPQLANRRVSGVFDANKPHTLVTFLAGDESIQIRESDKKTHIFVVAR